VSTGRITSIRADKGFGFIKEGSNGSTGNDVFFHRSALVGVDLFDLQEGQEVSFRTEPDPRDPSRFRAADVRVVQSDAAD
jgi:CspA family cold shock protein